MIYSLIISLVLTLIIELAISLIIGIRDEEDIKIVICANVITNPIVVFVANCIYKLNNQTLYYGVVLVLEVLAIITEGIIFKKFLKYKKISPMKVSIINNVISYSLGVLISNFM